jgi:hypothetical protein
MNYGITLLKCFYGNNIFIKADYNSLEIPKGKAISKEFNNFLSQCLCRNISKRSNWFNLYNHPFVKNLRNDSKINSIEDESILLDNEKLNIIFEVLNEKFKLINDYYEKKEFNEKTEYINEIEIILNLTLYEELLILKIFDRKDDKSFTTQNEISFIFLKKNGDSRFNINFANPIFKKMKILKLTNNKLIFDFISKLKRHINRLKDISLRIHEITKSSSFKGSYFDFLKKLVELVEASKYHDYFYSIFTKIDNYINEKKFKEALNEIPIAQYICEIIVFYNASIFQNNKEIIYFDNKELITQFNDKFREIINKNRGNKEKSTQNTYLLISFSAVLLRHYNNSIDIKEYHLQQEKASLDGFIKFYYSLKEKSIKCKQNIK